MSILNSKRNLLFIVFLLALLVHAPSLRNQFALDDFPRLVENVQVRSIEGGLAAFRQPTYPGNLFRPFLTFYFSLVYALAGYEPSIYHLINLLLHGVCALMVFSIFGRLITQTKAAVIASVFAVHPINVEAVANVSGSSELFYSVFVLGALRLGICLSAKRPPSQIIRTFLMTLAGAAIFFALASKESALCCIFLFLLVAYFYPACLSRGSLLRSLIPFSLSLMLYLALRIRALGDILGAAAPANFIDNPLLALSLSQRVINACLLLGKYIYLIIAPSGLSADYAYAQIVPAAWPPDFERIALSLIFLCATLAAVLGIRQRSPYSFALLWFFCGFAVTSNIFFPLGTIFAERLAYLPSLGIITLGCEGVFLLPFRARAIFVALLILLLAGQTTLQSRIWYDNSSLHTYQLRASPLSAKTQLNYAMVLKNTAKLAEAEVYVRRALEIYPEFPEAAFGMAVIHIKGGRLSDAESWLAKTLELNPRHLDALLTLGRLYFKNGRIERAEGKFKQALRVDPQNYPARVSMLAVLITKGNLDEARQLRDDLGKQDANNKEFLKLSQELNDRQRARPN